MQRAGTSFHQTRNSVDEEDEDPIFRAPSRAMTAIDFPATRAALKDRRNRALENLDVWLEAFEREATRRGTTVLFAETTEDAARLVADIARRHDVKKVIKTKSMVSEESALDHAIEAAGLTVVETDLGEYILQINDYEAPEPLYSSGVLAKYARHVGSAAQGALTS